jgi:hypothetical protein
LTPFDVVAGSNKKVWWQCLENPGHEWQATVINRTKGRGCPYCNKGWTLESIRLFVSSLKAHLETFTPAELYLLFQHNRLLQATGKGKSFVKALATGRFPQEEIAKFVNGEPSLVDQFVQDPTQTLEALETNEIKPADAEDSALDQADAVVLRTTLGTSYRRAFAGIPRAWFGTKGKNRLGSVPPHAIVERAICT